MKGTLAKTLQVVFFLNQYESKVLSVILAHGRCNVNKIVSIGEVPRSRVYGVAGTLSKIGFIKEHKRNRPEGKRKIEPVSWSPIDVETLKMVVEKRLMKDLKSKMSFIKRMEKQIEKDIKEEKE